MKAKKIIALTLAVIMAVLAFAGCSKPATSSSAAASSGAASSAKVPVDDGKTYELHAAYTVAEDPNSQHTIKFNKFKEIVEEKTNGKVKIIIHPASELGSEKEYVEMMMNGELAFASIATSVLSGFSDALKLYDTPMLFSTQEQVIKFTHSDVALARLEKLEDIDLVGLAATSVGSRNFLTVKDKPVTCLADMKGLKLRCMQTDIHIKALEMLGANPTPLAYNECYTAMQTNVVDGMENEVDTYLAMRFYEVAPNYAQVGWLQLVHAFLASKEIMDTLPEEYQKIILEAGWEAADYATEKGIEYAKTTAAQALKDAGANVIEVDNAEFREVLKPLVEQEKEMIGQDAIDWIAANPA